MKIWKGFSLMGILIVVMLGGMILGINRASFQRSLKSFVSDWSGGLNRTVTVYDYTGSHLKVGQGRLMFPAPNLKPGLIWMGKE